MYHIDCFPYKMEKCNASIYICGLKKQQEICKYFIYEKEN